ncbi:MAG TPA: hypothetical protein VMH40_02280 [Myxococcaceae bacterium]|nr:hypothetical protein [Myxococcaceae bacterium]
MENARGRHHHGDLRRALLDAALEVLSREGASALPCERWPAVPG